MRSLRYYEDQGLLKPKRTDNGYREYEESDVDWVKTIQLFLSIGATTEELSKFLDCRTKYEHQGVNPELVINFYQNKLSEVGKKMRLLQEAEKLIKNRLSSWRDVIEQQYQHHDTDQLIGGKQILREEIKQWIK